MNTTKHYSDSESSDDKPRRRRGFRFSLLTLFLLTTIIVLGISHWQTLWRLVQNQADVRMAKQHFGMLSIDDESKIHAIKLPLPVPLVWQWRVYLPPGRNYHLVMADHDIRAKGLASPLSAFKLEPGEVTITTQILASDTEEYRYHQVIDYRIVTHSPGYFRTPTVGVLSVRDPMWLRMHALHPAPLIRGTLDQTEYEIVTEGVGFGESTGQQSGAGDQPLVLLRLRDVKDINEDDNRKTAGFMIWINPVIEG